MFSRLKLNLIDECILVVACHGIRFIEKDVYDCHVLSMIRGIVRITRIRNIDTNTVSFRKLWHRMTFSWLSLPENVSDSLLVQELIRLLDIVQ